MRNKKIILNTLKVVLNNQKFLYTGLCKLAADLEFLGIITEKEYFLIWEYLVKNLPENPYRIGSPYRWKPCQWEPREKWLLEQIEKLEKEVKNEKH